MIIEICGTGCARCNATKDTIRKVIKEMGLEEDKQVALTEIKDPRDIAARGVFLTPAVVIDGVKLCEGRIPNPKEVKGWLEKGN